MPSQTEIDTAKAKAQTQADTNNAKAEQAKAAEQTQEDTAKAQAQTQKDTASAKSKQNGGDGGTGDRMTERENAAGLNMGGRSTTSARYIPMPTMAARERAAGLFDTMEGRVDTSDPFYFYEKNSTRVGDPIDHGLYDLPPANNFDVEQEDATENKKDTYHSFQIVKVPGEDSKVAVAPGTINGETTSQSTLPPQDGTQFSMGNNDSLWLDITLDTDGSVSSINIQKTEPTESETKAALRIGTVYLNSDGVIDGIANYLSGSQSLASCGETHFFSRI